jgi:hypothetical protein
MGNGFATFQRMYLHPSSEVEVRMTQILSVPANGTRDSHQDTGNSFHVEMANHPSILNFSLSD